MTNKATFLTCAILAILVLTACGKSAEDSSVPENSGATEENWRDQLSPELVSDIESAFREIGENPDNIISVEYVRTRETDLFDRRDYKVSFDRGELYQVFSEESRPWVHDTEYRITTQEWHEGEPEREQYPREYLTAIKFWFDDDSTNENQWAQNGTGQLQK